MSGKTTQDRCERIRSVRKIPFGTLPNDNDEIISSDDGRPCFPVYLAHKALFPIAGNGIAERTAHDHGHAGKIPSVGGGEHTVRIVRVRPVPFKDPFDIRSRFQSFTFRETVIAHRTRLVCDALSGVCGSTHRVRRGSSSACGNRIFGRGAPCSGCTLGSSDRFSSGYIATPPRIESDEVCTDKVPAFYQSLTDLSIETRGISLTRDTVLLYYPDTTKRHVTGRACTRI